MKKIAIVIISMFMVSGFVPVSATPALAQLVEDIAEDIRAGNALGESVGRCSRYGIDQQNGSLETGSTHTSDLCRIGEDPDPAASPN